MDIGRRLERLEALAGDGVDETSAERGERLRGIRERATNANERALRDGRIPPFEVSGDGYVVCSQDGARVVTPHQTSAEEWYWKEVESGYGHLDHDPEAQAFYTRSGDLALSRDFMDIRNIIPDRPL
jgi:hypothetical protein